MKILRLAKGSTSAAAEDQIRSIVLKHLKNNNIEMLNAMYSYILEEEGELDRGDLVAELRWEDLNKLASDVQRELQSKKTRDFADRFQSRGGKLREHKNPTKRLKIILERRKKRKLV